MWQLQLIKQCDKDTLQYFTSIFKNFLKYLFSHCSLLRVISLLRLFLHNSLRKGPGCLQTYTGSVTVMWQMMTLWRGLET